MLRRFSQSILKASTRIKDSDSILKDIQGPRIKVKDNIPNMDIHTGER